MSNPEVREIRSAPAGDVEIRSEAGKPAMLVGHGAVFYNPSDPSTRYMLAGDLEERVAPGAFDRALRDVQDVRALWNHSPDKVLGRTKSGTLRLSTDARGLRYEVDAPAHAADVVESIKRGDVTGSSFSFRVKKDTVTRETRDGRSYYIRTIEEIEKLYDVGPVTFPAYDGADAGARAAIVARAVGGDTVAEAERIRAAADGAEAARAAARQRAVEIARRS